MSKNNTLYPSTFYALFDGARHVTLIYMADDESVGPYWDGNGNPDLSRGQQQAEEDITVVSLGSGRYRLAERCYGPFSALRLHWGDEFMAIPQGDDELILQKVITPRKFVNYRFLASGYFNNENPIAQLLHSLGGGWETVAGGMLTLTVPVEMKGQFERRMESEERMVELKQEDEISDHAIESQSETTFQSHMKKKCYPSFNEAQDAARNLARESGSTVRVSRIGIAWCVEIDNDVYSSVDPTEGNTAIKRYLFDEFTQASRYAREQAIKTKKAVMIEREGVLWAVLGEDGPEEELKDDADHYETSVEQTSLQHQNIKQSNWLPYEEWRKIRDAELENARMINSRMAARSEQIRHESEQIKNTAEAISQRQILEYLKTYRQLSKDKLSEIWEERYINNNLDNMKKEAIRIALREKLNIKPVEITFSVCPKCLMVGSSCSCRVDNS